ncbi:amidohydrolase family protein [Actinomadura decatromicini]|uniref:Amidohydrolase n=1 Tax=Actinomadura decatromicini TaxID=2604572 RepID=A0A5D3F801_9ACTN|nr:amidohydrolase family protein [Actinomadura decatromicini]TYK44431.1 amidohydrolase [Actinomadura decatromicini]
MTTIPRIISVDDHVVEPPDLWTSRLPGRFLDRGPRIVRQKGRLSMPGGWREDPDGDWADVWLYDDLVTPLMKLSAAVGFDEVGFGAVTFDDIRPGCWKQADRLADMDANHMEASLCFPNTLPRFCGQAFMERDDKELALLCVRAYNDWMIDEWCAGPARGRLIPLSMVPLWDAELAAEEVRRCAAKGSHAVTFSENPHPLGLPSIHSGVWDPFFAACEETGTVVCLHIGSSSSMPGTSPDAPFIISSTLTFQNAMGSMLDFVFSGTLARFPNLTLAYSEGQVGWMPYVMERADKLWHERSDNSFGTDLPEPPTSYIRGRVYGCIFDDETGLANRDVIGMDQICFETDYPHADSTYPDSADVAARICDKAGLDDTEIYKLLRGNAIRAFGLERYGIAA